MSSPGSDILLPVGKSGAINPKHKSIHFQMDSWTDGYSPSNCVGTHYFLVLSPFSLDGGVYVLCQHTDHKQNEILKDKTLRFCFPQEEQHFDHV